MVWYTDMCQFGVLPIENSTAGSVNKIYDLMLEHNFFIVRTALNTCSKLWKNMIFGSLNNRWQASWENAPSTPWQATLERWGNSSGVFSREAQA